MSALSLFAICFSAVAILYLCIGDPKRRRAARERGEGNGKRARRLAAVLVCLPGACLIVAGDPAAFLNWLGGCAMLGWLVTLVFGSRATIEPR